MRVTISSRFYIATTRNIFTNMDNLFKGKLFPSDNENMDSKLFNRNGRRRLNFYATPSPMNLNHVIDEESNDSGFASDDEIYRLFCGSPVSRRKRPSGDDEPFPMLKKQKIMNEDDDFNGERILEAMNIPESDDEDLIGDFSKTYCLPTVTGKHTDLKSISSHTVYSLLNNDFDDVDSFQIIDCRYPYEFKGGHIQGANNLFTKGAIVDDLLFKTRQPPASDKRSIIIFHCEFSSERGPKMARFLRQKDRDINKDLYPSLHYPEIYILHGGYKTFHGSHPNQCQPNAYIPMVHSDYSSDLIHFRTRSKSWPRANGTTIKRLDI